MYHGCSENSSLFEREREKQQQQPQLEASLHPMVPKAPATTTAAAWTRPPCQWAGIGADRRAGPV